MSLCVVNMMFPWMFPRQTRSLPMVHCVFRNRSSKWLLMPRTRQLATCFHIGNMGLTNQKLNGERRFSTDSTKKSKLPASGYTVINNPKVFKGLNYSEADRDSLGIRGLLPPAIRTVELQVKSVLSNLRRYGDDLSRYLFLRELQDTNEKLFYRILCEHTEELMPYVYTPVVGEACLEYSNIYRRPRGLFITINDLGRVEKVLNNWPENEVQAVVVTDGERILGLGDLGANGMGIPVGKLSLYTALAAIPPSSLLPVTLDVGTNNEKLLKDPLYIGLRHKRITGEKYDALIDEFMQAVVNRYGRSCLIQFEDFANHNAFRLLEKYDNSYCTFNDDIQGTASVAVAGILASTKITGTKVSQLNFLFFGAGEAALGIAELLVMEMEEEGLTKEQAASKIWLSDSKGLIVKNRPSGGVGGHKACFAKDHPLLTNLEEMVKTIKPSALIGASAQPNTFTKTVLETMRENCERPIIFALSNPTDRAECTAEAAYTHTKGKCIFASGSPFGNVTYEGKEFHPGQGNNAYIFPGVALGIMAVNGLKVGNKVFLIAARALADMVTKENLDEGRVYPPLDTIRKVSLDIAAKVARYLYKENQAGHKPEPPDLEKFLTTKQFNHHYE